MSGLSESPIGPNVCVTPIFSSASTKALATVCDTYACWWTRQVQRRPKLGRWKVAYSGHCDHVIEVPLRRPAQAEAADFRARARAELSARFERKPSYSARSSTKRTQDASRSVFSAAPSAVSRPQALSKWERVRCCPLRASGTPWRSASSAAINRKASTPVRWHTAADDVPRASSADR